MQRTPRAGTFPPVQAVGPPLVGAIPSQPLLSLSHLEPTPNQRQMPIVPSPRRLLHCSHASSTRIPPSFSRRLRSLLPMGEGEDEGSDGRQWNEMEQNGTELKVSSLLATRDEANQGRLAHRVRVSGVPNEATVAPFSASLLGVNEANQGQMGPGINPPRRSREDGNLASLCGRPLCGCRGGSRTARSYATSNISPNQRQLPITPCPRRLLHCSHTSLPAKAVRPLLP